MPVSWLASTPCSSIGIGFDSSSCMLGRLGQRGFLPGMSVGCRGGLFGVSQDCSGQLVGGSSVSFVLPFLEVFLDWVSYFGYSPLVVMTFGVVRVFLLRFVCLLSFPVLIVFLLVFLVVFPLCCFLLSCHLC